MLDGMLQARCGNGKVYGSLIICASHQAINQTTAKTVAAADTVHNVDAIGGGELSGIGTFASPPA